MNTEAVRKKNRHRKYHLFLQQIKPTDHEKILDVGFANREYSDVDNYLEKNDPYPSRITALGIDDSDIFQQRYPSVEVVCYDGKTFPFSDGQFDVGWSNAVIEHVGDEEAQVYFLKELCRTCKRVYFTTPNRYFPFELHTRLLFIHWLPKRIFDYILSFTSKKWATGNYMYLLSIRKLKKILKKAGITNYHIFKNRFCGLTMDFSIVIPSNNVIPAQAGILYTILQPIVSPLL